MKVGVRRSRIPRHARNDGVRSGTQGAYSVGFFPCNSGCTADLMSASASFAFFLFVHKRSRLDAIRESMAGQF
jgi:hypothetical protein